MAFPPCARSQILLWDGHTRISKEGKGCGCPLGSGDTFGAFLSTCSASTPRIPGHQGRFATPAHSLELTAGLVPVHADNKALIHCVGVLDTLGMASQGCGFLLCSVAAGMGGGMGVVLLESAPSSPGFAMGKGLFTPFSTFPQMKLVLPCSWYVLGTSWAVRIFWAQTAEFVPRTSSHKAVCRTGSHNPQPHTGSSPPWSWILDSGPWRLELGFARLQLPAPGG